MESVEDPFLTVATFTYPHDMYIVMGRMESEGIECRTLDELSIQVYNYASDALGGVKLQVRSSQKEAAEKILLENEILTIEETNDAPLWPGLERWSRKIPFLSVLPFEVRMIVLSTTTILLLVLSIFLMSRPTLKDQLMDSSWCIEFISHNGQSYEPRTTGLMVTFEGQCTEDLQFREQDHCSFPGFNTRRFYGAWQLKGDSLEFSSLEDFNQVFSRRYQVNVDGPFLELKSDSTLIQCRKQQPFEYNFDF